jgi:hypothetical protein
MENQKSVSYFVWINITNRMKTMLIMTVFLIYNWSRVIFTIQNLPFNNDNGMP